MVNIAPLQAALDKITADPEHHDQGIYFSSENIRVKGDRVVGLIDCKTYACLAGEAILQNGDYVFVGHGDLGDAFHNVIPKTRLEDWLNGQPVEFFHAERVASEIFGISRMEASTLFDSINTRLHLWSLAYALTDGRIVLPGDVAHQEIYKEKIIKQLGRFARTHIPRWADESEISYLEVGVVDNYPVKRWAIALRFFLGDLPEWGLAIPQ